MSICRHKNHIPDKFRTNNVLCLDCNVSIHKDAVKPSYDELQAEVERLQGFDHIRSIMVFYINREPMGDENIEVDDIVREYLAEGREE